MPTVTVAIAEQVGRQVEKLAPPEVYAGDASVGRPLTEIPTFEQVFAHVAVIRKLIDFPVSTIPEAGATPMLA